MLLIMAAYELFLLLIVVKYGSSSLQCYNCLTDSEKICKERQKETRCSILQQGSCMTLAYTTEKDKRDTVTYRKGCWESKNDCENICGSLVGKIKDCKVSCCEGDLCNGGNLKPEKLPDKKKRSTNQTNSATSSYTSSIMNFTLVALLWLPYCCTSWLT